MKRYFEVNGGEQFNHGCSDYAVYQDNGDGTATCVEVSSCASCWQVGHDDQHVFALIGDVVPIKKFKSSWR